MELESVMPPGNEVSLDSALEMALAAHRRKELEDAAKWYRAILQVAPNHAVANHNLGTVYIQLGNLNDGLPYLQAALDADPESIEFWLSFVDALIRSGQSESAAEVIVRGLASELPPSVRRILTVLAAKLSLESGVSAPPQDSELEALLSFVRQARYSDAISFAEGLTQQFPSHGFAWKVLGSVFLILGRQAEALEYLKIAAHLLPDDAEVHNNLAVAYRRSHQLDAALSSGQSATSLRPNFAEALNNVGMILLDLRRLADAEVVLRRAVVESPDYADAHNNLGRVFLAQKKYFEAEPVFREALRLSPTLAEAHNNLGLVHLALSENRNAALSFKRALRDQPDFPDALNNLGMARRALGNSKDAEFCISRAIELRPDFAEAHNNLGIIKLENGQLEAAQKALLRAVALAPRLATAYSSLGRVYFEMDNLPSSVESFRRALEIDPENSGLEAGIYLAGLYYLDGQLTDCRSALDAIASIRDKKVHSSSAVKIYWQFIDRLLTLAPIPSSGDRLPKIYVVGDAQALSAHGLEVLWRGSKMRCSTEWLMRCRIEDFRQQKNSSVQQKVKAVFSRLPRGSEILLMIGEADCRPDMGFIIDSQNSSGRTLGEIVTEAASGYITFVCDAAKNFDHKLIVFGIPAATSGRSEIGEKEANVLAELIRSVNQELQSLANGAGIDFIDAFKLTAGANGIANGRRHIDRRHLLPGTIAEAFDAHQAVTPRQIEDRST